MTFANTNLPAASDGLPYCVGKTVPTTEADLFNQQTPNQPPVPLLYNQAVVATVVLTAAPGARGPTYVILQSSCDNGQTWFDVSWLQTAFTSGSQTFVLSGGTSGSNAFQQSRQANTAPGSSGYQQIPLGGIFRFVGKTGSASSASPSPSPSPGVAPMQATIYFRLLGLR